MSYTKAQRKAKKNEKWLIPLTITGVTFFLSGYIEGVVWGVNNAYFTHTWLEDIPFIAFTRLIIGLGALYIGACIQNKQEKLLNELNYN